MIGIVNGDLDKIGDDRRLIDEVRHEIRNKMGNYYGLLSRMLEALSTGAWLESGNDRRTIGTIGR